MESPRQMIKLMWLLVLCCALSALSQYAWIPLLLNSNPLDSVILSSTNPTIQLGSLAKGNNLTYDVQGSYYQAGVAVQDLQPSILQGFQLLNSTTKTTQAQPNANIGLLASPGSTVAFHSVSQFTLSAWYCESLQLISSYAFAGQPLHLSVLGDKNTSLIVAFWMNRKVLTIAYGTFSVKGGYNISPNIFSDTDWTKITAISCSETADFPPYSVNCVAIGTDSKQSSRIVAYTLNETTSEVEVTAELSETTLNFTANSLIGVVVNQDYVTFYSSINGLLMNSFNDIVTNVWHPLVSEFPVYDQTIFTCISSGDELFAVSSNSTLQYSYSSNYENSRVWHPARMYPTYEDNSPFTLVDHMTVYNDYVGFVAYSETREASIRILDQSTGYIFYDGGLCVLIPEDCSSPFSLGIVGNWLLLETSAKIYVFNIIYDVQLNLGTATIGEYSFVGTLSVNSVSIPLNAMIYQPNSTTIYRTRNEYIGQQDMYLSPSLISRSLNTNDSVRADVYIPLSNYFSGHCISYNVTMHSNDTASLTTPQLLTYSEPYIFSEMDSTLHIINMITGVIAVESNNVIYLFDATSTNAPCSNISLQNDTKVTQLISYCPNDCFLVAVQYNGDKTSTLHFYNISDPCRPIKLQIVELLDTAVFTFGEQYLFGLHTNSISMYNASVTSGKVDLNFFEVLDAETLNLNSFSPINISYSDNLIVLDKNCRLLIVDVDTFNVQEIQENCTNSEQAQLIKIGTDCGLIDPSSTTMIRLYGLDTVAVFPIFANSTYITAQATSKWLAVYAQWRNSNYLFIYELDYINLRSLLTTIDIGQAVQFSLLETDSFLCSLYWLDGLKLNKVVLGQQGIPQAPSSSLVQDDYYFTMWARLHFSFTSLVNKPFYHADVNITAWSCISGENLTTQVTIYLNNSGTFILINETDSTNALVSGGTVNVGDEVKVFDVPQDYFDGADIAYAFVVNERYGTPLLSSKTCNGKSSIACITERATDLPIYPPPPEYLDYEIYTNIRIAEYNYFGVWGGFLGVPLQSPGNTTFISFINSDTLAFRVAHVENSSNLFVACCYDYSSYSYEVYLLDVKNDTYQARSDANFCDVFISATLINQTRVIIYTVTWNSIDVFVAYDGEMEPSASITPETLQMGYYFDPFAVISIERNHQYLIFVDYFQVFIFEVIYLNSDMVTYEQVWQTASSEWGTYFSGIAVSSDEEVLLILLEDSSILKYSLLNVTQPSLSQVVSAVDTELSVSFENSLITDQHGDYACFLAYEDDKMKLRLVNFSRPGVSQVVASSDLGVDYRNVYDSSMLDISAEQDFCVVVQAVLFLNITEEPLMMHRLKFCLSAKAYLYPMANSSISNQHITLQLQAYNIASKAEGHIFTVNYTK